MLAELSKSFAQDQPGVLRHLYISLSNVCNAGCSYCDVHQTVPQRGEFSQADVSRVLADARDLGCTMVHFMGGGEPLISRDFVPAAKVCAELGMDIAVTTNGSHLKTRFLALPADAPVRLVLVSLDSHLPEIHDRVRKIPGLWQRALDGIAECRARFPQARIVFNHILTNANIEYLDAFVRWGGKAGAHAVNIIPVKDTPSLSASSQQAVQFAERQDSLRAAAGESGIDLLYDDSDGSAWASEMSGHQAAGEYRCVFPEHALYLDLPTGGIFPCDCTVHRKPASRFRLGDLWTDGLAATWRGRQIADMREVLASPCDPGCKAGCDWNNRRSNRVLRNVATGQDRGAA